MIHDFFEHCHLPDRTKWESPFKNFELETETFDNLSETFGTQVLELIVSTRNICAYRHLSKGGTASDWRQTCLSNMYYIRLANFAQLAYEFGCKKAEIDTMLRRDVSSIQAWECYIDAIGQTFFDEVFIKAERLPRQAQLLGICVLQILDDTLSVIRNDGFCINTANALLLASRILGDAKNIDNEIQQNEFEQIVVDSTEESLNYMRAKAGGDARSAKIKACEQETIRLYKLGRWGSLPEAALAITPQVVEFSKNHTKLQPSTTRPLKWIRAYVASLKGQP
ncbi:hypothetical protein [Massilia sp. TSP1-1-2]|uniref:hypothetical protein n=2 Tax=unclassified Massilia TaxID=2609279 RepID=UPI003CF579DC